MTRPIYEPNTQRTDAFLDFQQQQLFRRPAPVTGGSIPEAAHMASWSPDTSATIASQTWTNLGSIGEYTYGAYTDGGGESDWSVNLNTGVIGWTPLMHVYVEAQIRWATTFVAGNVVALRLFFAGTAGYSVAHTHIIPAGGANFASATVWFGAIAAGFYANANVRLDVYQDSGVGKDLDDAELYVARVSVAPYTEIP